MPNLLGPVINIVRAQTPESRRITSISSLCFAPLLAATNMYLVHRSGNPQTVNYALEIIAIGLNLIGLANGNWSNHGTEARNRSDT